MATKRYLRFVPAFLFLTVFAFCPQAQDTSDVDNADKETPRFFQRLIWTGGEYALRYGVIVQKETDGTYVTYLREFTKTASIIVSLPPGDYRLQVSSYNVLDNPEELSPWLNFKVLPAVDSEIVDIMPAITASGGNGGASAVKDALNGKRKGAERAAKPALLFAAAEWLPVVPFHGDFWGESFSPAGGGVRVGAAFPITEELSTGVELSALWQINADNDESALSAGINIVTMKRLQNRTASLNFRLGVSFIASPDTQDKLTFHTGASYLRRFTGNLFMETGIDYAALLRGEYFDGRISPRIGVGRMF